MIENAIYQRLAAHSGLSALISARIYPQILPETPTYPAVTYWITGAPRETAMGSDPGIVHARVQVDAWGLTFAVARNVGEQVRAALQRWRGTLDGTEVLDSFIEDARDQEPELINGVLVRNRQTDLTIHYRE
jgi:hypothetical protein